MPHTYVEVDFEELLPILVRQGYQLHNNRNAGIQLTRPDPNPANRFRTTGEPRRILMHPVSREHYTAIMRRSHNAQEAAQQIIAISTGAQLGPQFAYESSGTSIDAEAIERIVSTRAANEVSAVTEGISKLMSEQQRRIEELEERLAKQSKPVPVGKRGPGRPKGSKNKPKSEKSDEPELTPEQEAEYNRIMGNLGTKE